MTTTLQFESPITITLVAGAIVLAVGGWCLFRWLAGAPAAISRRMGLYMLRGVIVVTVMALLLNPVEVSQMPGLVERPEVFYLLDSSQSMALGAPTTRWDEAVQTIRDVAEATRGTAHADVKLFRFGQRLLASDDYERMGLEKTQSQGTTAGAARVPLSGEALAAERTQKSVVKSPLAPTDGDTQLVTALRQISSRFGHKPPASIVLFSDGRARDETGVDQIVSQFQRLQVPIHVLPTGSLGKRGDISIVAAVVPPRVRKFLEVEVQVFIRSYGFEGHRTEVVLSIPDAPGKPGRKLSSVPVTLHSGFQAATLTFRSEMETHRVQVAIASMPDEISESNNSLSSEIAIDRTKIRVLYVEGSSQPLAASQVGGRQVIRGPYSDLQRALMEDDDIECVVLSSMFGAGRLNRVSENSVDSARAFPETKAELAAFDAILLSDIAERSFTEKQLEWVEEWIGQRGGGLLMVGGSRSFASGGWNETVVAQMLPIEMLPGNDWNPGEQVRWKPNLGSDPHPVWTILSDQRRNREVVESVPGFAGANRFAGVKPNLTLVLADSVPYQGPPLSTQPRGSNSSQTINNFTRALESIVTRPTVVPGPANGPQPSLVVGRYGRGRTMAISTAVVPPWANDFVNNWKQGEQNYYSKFWRNVVYWLTENSSIGRRRLIATADKRFYHPGDTITLGASAFNELARQTKDYRIVAMIEPNAALKDNPGDYSPLRWPEGMTRTSGEEGPFIAWGEEIEIPITSAGDKPTYGFTLPIADALSSGSASHSLRVELTAYEDLTQVDSTSLDVQILHDPFELQNPFPNHDLLKKIAGLSGGRILSGASDLTRILEDLPVKVGPPVTKKTPIWSTWALWTWLLGLLTIEWLWRRKIGLA